MSKKEDVLNALCEKLKQIQGIEIHKNQTIPQKIPDCGIIFLRDGNMGEPEILLSPTLFIYKHTAEVEVIVQNADPQKRDAQMDSLLEKIGQLLINAPSLMGNVDFAYAENIQVIEEVIEGAPAMKAVIVNIVLEYASTTPLT